MKTSELRDKTDDELTELESELRQRLLKLQPGHRSDQDHHARARHRHRAR